MAHTTLRARNQNERKDPEESQETTCPECDGRLRTANSETTCEECGLVASDQHIDHGPEWRNFDNKENQTRTGAPRTAARHDKGLSTTMYTTTDGNGNRLSAKKQAKMHRLRTHQSRSRYETKGDRNQMHVFTEIRRITSALGLAQSVRDRSCDLFRTAQKEDLIHGRTLEGFAAACVYATCRCMGLPWERDEFKTVARCPPGRVDAAYDAMNQNLELPLQPLPAKSFVPRYATELDVGDSVRQEAEELAEQADESRTINCAPGSVAGAALYLASLGTAYELTQTQVAAVAECTPNTIRCRSRDLRDLRDA